MKRILAALLIAGALAACTSTPTQEQEGAKVEDRTASTPPPAEPSRPAPGAMTSKPVGPGAVAMDPLKDPGNILSKRSIYFDYDSNAVKDEFRPVVSAHGKYLGQNRNTRVRIEGNTDERGSREYNVALGQRRSESVKRMLMLLGGREDQIEAVSLGEEKPRATGSNEEAWAQNRRSDMLYPGEY